MYEFTCQLATQPPPPEMRQLLAAVGGNQEAMDQFVQMNADMISPTEFLSPESIGRNHGRGGATRDLVAFGSRYSPRSPPRMQEAGGLRAVAQLARTKRH